MPAGHLADGSAGLYDPANVSVVPPRQPGPLRANVLYQQDRDYIVRDGEIMLIDEFTGRMMHGRRLSEGLHQAIEAKDGVDVQPENQTLASVTIQNYFRLYGKLAGMTGTAATEAQEFFDISRWTMRKFRQTGRFVRKDDDDGGLSDRRKEEQGDHRADRRLPQPRPAGAGGHGVDREVRSAVGIAGEPHLGARRQVREEECAMC